MNLIKLYSITNKINARYPRIYSVLRTLYESLNIVRSSKYFFLRICPIYNHKIVFSCYGGKGYCDNPKYIAEELLRNNQNYDLIWLIHPDFEMASEIPSEIRTVKYGSFKATYHLATAKIWIDNVRKLTDTRKRLGQHYIQTWHGFGPKGNKQVSPVQAKALKKDSDITDLFLSNNSFLSDYYHTNFYYDGEIMMSGFPRNDVFFSDRYDEIVSKVHRKLKIPRDVNILLYAPTMRNNLNLNFCNIDYKRCTQNLETKWGGKWILLLRLHHGQADDSYHLIGEHNNLIDASHYLDMQELLLVADILITDYSSCMFDFVLTGKPCILYHPDEMEYESSTGFCIQPEELPFPRAHSNEELQQIIEDFDEESYIKTLNEYLENIGMCDNGTASKAVVDWIEEKINAG